MPSQQQDYIVRHIQTIARLLERLRRKGRLLDADDRREIGDALLQTLQLQEQNFGRPAAEFLALPADEQFEALRRSETKAAGHDRCLTYIILLRTAADLYAVRDSSDLAAGARQLALYVSLRLVFDEPRDQGAVRLQIDELLRLLDGAALFPPTQHLLARFQENS